MVTHIQQELCRLDDGVVWWYKYRFESCPDYKILNMEIKKISEVKLNPNNPRLIKDDKFKKLVQSIKDFPEMLSIRPIVVNQDMIILGGTMRFRACKEAGITEIPVIVTDLSEDKQREFLIKDNISGGEWDWDLLANEWDNEELVEWGLDVWTQPMDINEMNESDINIEDEFDPIGTSSGLQRVVFIFDGPEEAESWLAQHPSLQIKKTGMGWQIDLTTIELLKDAK